MNRVYIFLKKIPPFLKRYLFVDPLFVFYYAWAYFQKTYATEVKFYSREDIKNLICAGKSFIRLGDGEIGMMHGSFIHYQKYEKDLDRGFKKIIYDYNNSSSYILAIPIFASYSNTELLKVENKLRCWLPLKIEFNRRFNKNMMYGDAHIFYYKNWFQENIAQYLKTKKIIVNTTQENIDLQKKTLESEFTILKWIPAQSPNPFDLYEETKKEVTNIIDTYDGNIKDLVILMSSGPMGKLLAHEFCHRVQCIDVGAGFEQLYNNINFEHRI